MKSLIRFLLLIGILYFAFAPLIYGNGRSKGTHVLVHDGKIKEDGRVRVLRTLFSEWNSPLAGLSADFIQIADKYKLDWKILPSIAGVESGFETNGNIYDFNPFGYMCGDSPCVFDNYKQAVTRVAETISGSEAYENYRKTGSIYELATHYNYVSPQDWTQKIEYFQEELK